MTNVLVCIKRVPDLGGEITLTADGMSVDDTSLGHTVSPHEECAVELAISVAKDTGGEATVLTLGSAEAIEQLRNALAVGCTGAVLLEADPGANGPADVAAAIAELVRAHEAAGTTYDLVLLGNDASDTGDFQVGVRLSYLLDRPVVAGVSTLSVGDGTVTARGGSPDGGTEIFEVPLPAVLTVMEGGIEPRYPTIPGRMKAKKVKIEQVTPSGAPTGPGRLRLKLPPAQPSQVSVLGEGAEAAPAVVDLLEKLGVLR
ncbi:MAG: electron transfer flavoprotein beta subunit [Nocardioidaceae bacterium]|jgi:electron transfer flavoprotein beta subunit|nr:electron transfer flavoprotein beta subunit [Nocardioidaceae bacterium]